MANNIRISQLTSVGSADVSFDDFMPLVDSASLTTYRVSLTNFNVFTAASGSARSASYAVTASHAYRAISSSRADTSSYSILSQDLVYPNSSTASWAVTASHAQRATTSDLATTSSYAARTTTASYAISASNAGSASHAISSSFASISTTASFVATASWAVNTNTASYFSSSGGSGGISGIPIGGIVAYASSSAPSSGGWLTCNGSAFSAVAYPDLALLIGTQYGEQLLVTETITPESTTTYGTANNGQVKIEFVSGGSGYYSITLNSITTVLTVSGAANYVTFTGLNSITYPATITDLGFNPDVVYNRSYVIPYGGVPAASSSYLTSSQYRTPGMDSVWGSSPLVFMIKT